MTVWSLVCVASLFKKGDDRSFNQYVSSLKGFHVEAGRAWTQEIEYARAWCKRSVLRGIGPARQSHELDLPAAIQLPDSETPWSDNGPLWPRRVVSVGSAFLGRVIEIANARGTDMSLNHSAREVTWLLPASKSDPEALGVKRTLGCLCGVPGFPCPFHVAALHLCWLETESVA